MRYCHSVRGHPECDGIYNDWGAMHKWQKRMIHKGIRRQYKNKDWLRGAIADADGLNPSKLRVQLSS